MTSKLTIETLKSVLDYDPETGRFTWKVPQSNRVKTGDRAGTVAMNGRRYLAFLGEKFMAHRLAWFYVHGRWPVGDIKQKDGNFDNAAIDNLIEQSEQDTAFKRRPGAKSRSGHPGVTWATKAGKWQVHVTRDYKQVFIGQFVDLNDAVAARQEAERDKGIGLSGTARAAAAHAIVRRRRQRAAWRKVGQLGVPVAWTTFDAFAADVGDIPETRMDIIVVDASQPIGPGNWRWSLPPEKKHDFKGREGRIAYNRAHRAANPDHYRDKELRRHFGITLVQYRQKMAEQGGVCAICGSDEITERNGKKLAMAVDHDHETGELRGLLCIACNTAIGKMRDDPHLLKAGASYLESHGKRVPTDFEKSVNEAVARSPHRDWLLVATPGFGEHAYG